MAITETQLKSQIIKLTESFEEARVYGADTLVSTHDELDALLRGTKVADTASQFVQLRQNVVAFLASAKTVLETIWSEYAQVLGTVAGKSFPEIWAAIVRDYAENAKFVRTRGWVFGTPAITGTGNGELVRLNVDEWGNVLEYQTADAKVARCDANAASGALKHEEHFTLEGATAGRDVLVERGSGRVSEQGLRAISARRSLDFQLRNPSFSYATPAGATATPTEITDWTSSEELGGAALAVSGTNYEVIDDYYRGYEGDTTPLALRCKALDFCLSQNLAENGAKFKRDVPVYFRAKVRRKNSADGTFRLRLSDGTSGGVMTEIDLTDLTNDQWTSVAIGPGTGNWYRNFGSSTLTLSLEREDGTVGQVDLDDVVIDEFQFFDGGYYALDGGDTPFEIEDKITWSDTEAGVGARSAEVRAIHQTWLHRALGRYLSACPAAPEDEPTVALSATAGSVTTGDHVVAAAFVDAFGREGAPGPVSATVTGDGTKKVDVTDIPVGGPHVATVKLYMSKAGTTTPLYYTGVSVDNGVTSATGAGGIGVADAALTVASKVGITLAEPSL